MLITFNNVSWQYLDKPILKNVSFTINENNKIGLIGINGAGKSTLLKLITGELSPSSGMIYRKSNIKIGYLSQELNQNPDNTVLQEALDKASLIDEFEIKSMLNKIGLTSHQQLVKNLSGGEKKRLEIVSVLVSDYDLLILDEPTNHLDIPMICWLEKYLIKYNKALLLVTHDRYFLERITNIIMEIENGGIYLYETNYEGFLSLKAERFESLVANQRRLNAILKKEAEWLKMNPQARSTKSKERIMRFDEYVDNLNNIKETLKEAESSLELSSKKTRMGKKTIILDHLNVKVEDQLLIKDFSYIVDRFDRLGIVGNNGCGKTSLFNSILSPKEAENGKIIIGETICIGYFKQIDEMMSSNKKVIDYLKEYGEYVDTINGKLSASQLLENYLFTPNMQQLPVSKLSGGEKRRLSLLKVLITNPNVLFLDEPTNDMDIYTIELLEDYLEAFKGAVIVVSHDRYFLDKVCNHLFIFENKILKQYMFSISEYLQSHEMTLIKTIKEEQTIKDKVNKNEIPRFTSAEKKEYDNIEKLIFEIESKIKELEIAINQTGSNYELLIELTNQKHEQEKLLEEKIARWEYLEEINEKILKYKEHKYE